MFLRDPIRIALVAILVTLQSAAFAQDSRAQFAAGPILQAMSAELPAHLRAGPVDAICWAQWLKTADAQVRHRLDAGEEDTLAKLLRFGVTFTKEYPLRSPRGPLNSATMSTMPEVLDVYISYSAKNREFVRRLADGLRDNGLSIFYDELIDIGENWRDALESGRERARFIVIVMSPEYFQSRQTEVEWTAGLKRESNERRLILLPVMYQMCEVPTTLAEKVWADFQEPGEFAASLRKLVAAMRTNYAPGGVGSSEREIGRPQPPTPFEFPQPLLESLSEGNCVLYAGAGLSAPAGLPTWQQFADLLVRAAVDADFVTGQDREFFENALRDLKGDYVVDEIVGRASGDFLQQFLRTTFLGKSPPEAHGVLRDLPFAAALTTNFDNLLEVTFQKNVPSLPVFTPKDTDGLLGAFTRRDFFILKLYGSLDRPEDMLVSPAQFDRAISENPIFQRFMETLFISRTILFVGCSLEGIETYLRGLRFPTLPNARHFALSGVLGSSWEAMAGVLARRYGIQVIPYRRADPFDQLHALQELRRYVGFTGKGVTKAGASRLKKVILDNIGPFEHQEIPIDPKINVLLGNNGVGKSTILRAIAVALCGKEADPYTARLIRSDAQTASIQLETDLGTYRTVLQRTKAGVESTSSSVGPLDAEGWLAVGFPPLRTNSGDNVRRQFQSSPFPTVQDVLPLAKGEADIRLDDLQTWIVDVDYRAKHELSTKSGDGRYERLIHAFFGTISRLLAGVKVEFESVDPVTRRVLVCTDDGIVPLEYVSQGTSSLMGWVGVLLQRLYEIYGAEMDASARYVLVLMDEIDAHMHPAWQQILLPRIQECFPGMQLIATTHSALVLSGLEDTNVMHVVRSPETHRVEIRKYEMKLKGLETDEILTGPLFGLHDTRDLGTQAKERRYDQLRSLPSPTPEEVAERRALARDLFGSRAPSLESASTAIAEALQRKPEGDLTPSSEERARLLAEAEKLIEKTLAGRS